MRGRRNKQPPRAPQDNENTPPGLEEARKPGFWEKSAQEIMDLFQINLDYNRILYVMNWHDLLERYRNEPHFRANLTTEERQELIEELEYHLEKLKEKIVEAKGPGKDTDTIKSVHDNFV